MKLNSYVVVSSKERPHVPLFSGRVTDMVINGVVLVTITNRRGVSNTYKKGEVKITEVGI